MDTDKNSTETPFKIFLDKSTNLITIFGVFNALFIYSSSIANTEIKSFLLPSFFLLSMFVWLELIIFALRSSDGGNKYHLFYFLLCLVEIGLVYYFFILFKDLLIVLGAMGIFWGVIYGIVMLFIWMLAKYLARLKEKNREKGIFIVILTSMIITVTIFKIVLHYSLPQTQKSEQPKSIVDSPVSKHKADTSEKINADTTK
jgi:hypothetical protein